MSRPHGPTRGPISLTLMPPLPGRGSLASRHCHMSHRASFPPSGLAAVSPSLQRGGSSTLPGGVAGRTGRVGTASRVGAHRAVSAGSCFLRAHRRHQKGEKQPRPPPGPASLGLRGGAATSSPQFLPETSTRQQTLFPFPLLHNTKELQ